MFAGVLLYSTVHPVTHQQERVNHNMNDMHVRHWHTARLVRAQHVASVAQGPLKVVESTLLGAAVVVVVTNHIWVLLQKNGKITIQNFGFGSTTMNVPRSLRPARRRVARPPSQGEWKSIASR